MRSTIKSIARPIGFYLLVVSLFFSKGSLCQQPVATGEMIEIGIARVDITPVGPIRLAGYGNRSKSETVEILHRLKAEAMAFGKDAEHPSVIITVDLVGITDRITSNLKQALSKKAGIDPAQVM